MSTNTSQLTTTDTTTDTTTPSDEELLTFTKSDIVQEKMKARNLNLAPERMLKHPLMREFLVKALEKYNNDQAVALENQQDAGVLAMLEEEFLGVKPAEKRSQSVKDWIRKFRVREAEEGLTVRIGDDGVHRCSAPGSVPCCDKKHKVHAYTVIGGRIYGLCQNMVNASKALGQEAKDAGDGCSPGGIFFMSLDKAKEKVAKQEEKVQVLDSWTGRFVAAETDGTAEHPVARYSEDEQGSFPVCGAPEEIGCCKHDRLAYGFIQLTGEVVGICRNVAAAFRKYGEQNGDADCIRYAKDFETAQGFAEQWRKRYSTDTSDGDGGNTSSPGSRGEKLARDKAQKERQEARQAADDAARPAPNNASGDITKLGLKNPNGGKKNK